MQTYTFTQFKFVGFCAVVILLASIQPSQASSPSIQLVDYTASFDPTEVTKAATVQFTFLSNLHVFCKEAKNSSES